MLGENCVQSILISESWARGLSLCLPTTCGVSLCLSEVVSEAISNLQCQKTCVSELNTVLSWEPPSLRVELGANTDMSEVTWKLGSRLTYFWDLSTITLPHSSTLPLYLATNSLILDTFRILRGKSQAGGLYGLCLRVQYSTFHGTSSPRMELASKPHKSESSWKLYSKFTHFWELRKRPVPHASTLPMDIAPNTLGRCLSEAVWEVIGNL